MSENFKKLTGKRDYENVVKHLVNDCDCELFKELIEKDEFLFDFVKQNVADRISKAINENNYKNLLSFMKYYSPAYEDVIVSNLVKYADEDLTDTLLEKFSNGNDDEKTYCAKYFGIIKDSLAYELLRINSCSQNQYLCQNCAISLSQRGDKESYNESLLKLNSNDDFEKYTAVKFLIAYGEKDAVKPIINAMKSSAIAENIAGEIPYLQNLFEILDENYQDALIIINHIVNGLGEILPLCMVFDFELYDVFEKLINEYEDSKSAVVLLNASEKFSILTENDEYLFDEDKDTQNEIKEIKKQLVFTKDLKKHINSELYQESPFVFTALDFADDVSAIRNLLKSDNQTLILKTSEVLKKLGNFDEASKSEALNNVTDENIKSVINAIEITKAV